MAQLSYGDFRAILDFVEELYASKTLDAYTDKVVNDLSTIIRSDVCTFNESNPQRRRAHWVANAEEIPDARTIFARHMHEHPFIQRWNPAMRTHNAVTLGDFLSRRQWRDRGVYTEFYRPAHIEHQLAVALRAASPRELHVGLFRETADFDERDRLVLDLLAPHLSTAYEHAETVDALGTQLNALRQGLEASGRAIISLGADGGIRHMSERARTWLKTYFGPHWSDQTRLPPVLEVWVSSQQQAASGRGAIAKTRRPMIVERNRRRLAVLPLSEQGSGLSLLLCERKLCVEPEDLASLGLSPRETEVLAWLTGGKSNREIADILGLSPATIKHCVERVFAKLNVGTRAAATAIAVATAGADGR